MEKETMVPSRWGRRTVKAQSLPNPKILGREGKASFWFSGGLLRGCISCSEGPPGMSWGYPSLPCGDDSE